MLPIQESKNDGPLLVMLHWLGGSGRSWSAVREGCVARGIAGVAIDLPGFGEASELRGFSVSETADSIISTIQSVLKNQPGPWLLAGHSMGGKFATIVARAALDGAPGLEELRGLILLSPSPPSPEPMDEDVRQKNIDSLGHSTLDAEEDRAHAESFIDANTGKLPLPANVRRSAVDQLLHANRTALIDWFTTGSREDWAARVGILPIPALILAGTTESALGPEAQRNLTLSHLPSATLVELEGAGHLSPLERPDEIADRILVFAKTLGLTPRKASELLDPAARGLIESRLTSPQTRAVFMQRLADDQVPEPDILHPDRLLTLRAIARRIIPDCPFDLAARLHRWLAFTPHDGWRHDTLPPDLQAWQVGLESFDAASSLRHKVSFSALDTPRQDELLLLARDGKLFPGLLTALHLTDHSALYSAAQMSDWFSDLHAELTRIYIADPRTMHRIGFTGFADEAGFTQIRLNEREEFES